MFGMGSKGGVRFFYFIQFGYNYVQVAIPYQLLPSPARKLCSTILRKKLEDEQTRYPPVEELIHGKHTGAVLDQVKIS